MELNSERLKTLLNVDQLAKIVIEDYVKTIDFSLQYYKKGLFGINMERSKNIKTLFKVKDSSEVTMNSDTLKKYIDILMQTDPEYKFMTIDNFAFSEDKHRIATMDFRILVDDLSGKVPKWILLHAASIATAMLSGLLEYAIGYDHIVSMMDRYGYTKFSYQSNGYLRLVISKDKVEFNRNFEYDYNYVK